MKIRPINFTAVLILVAMLQTIAMVYAQPVQAIQHHRKATLPAYHNQVFDIIYNDKEQSIDFICKVDPICMYTPLTYADSLEDSLRKTYFLPRTKYAGFKKQYEGGHAYQSLKERGIALQIDEITEKNYGLALNFVVSSDDPYDIIKVIDRDNKVVRFTIVPKI